MSDDKAQVDRTDDNNKSKGNANEGNFGNPNTSDADATKDAAKLPEADSPGSDGA